MAEETPRTPRCDRRSQEQLVNHKTDSSSEALYNGSILTSSPMGDFMKKIDPCSLRCCKNRPTPFPGRMLCKATKQGCLPCFLSQIVLSMLG